VASMYEVQPVITLAVLATQSRAADKGRSSRLDVAELTNLKVTKLLTKHWNSTNSLQRPR
jgi:hypothetical protein